MFMSLATWLSFWMLMSFSSTRSRVGVPFLTFCAPLLRCGACRRGMPDGRVGCVAAGAAAAGAAGGFFGRLGAAAAGRRGLAEAAGGWLGRRLTGLGSGASVGARRCFGRGLSCAAGALASRRRLAGSAGFAGRRAAGFAAGFSVGFVGFFLRRDVAYRG